MYYARPISTLFTFVTTSSPSFPLLFLSPFFPLPFLPFLSSFPSFPFLLFLSSFPSFLLFLSLLSSPFLSFFIFCGASQHRKSADFSQPCQTSVLPEPKGVSTRRADESHSHGLLRYLQRLFLHSRGLSSLAWMPPPWRWGGRFAVGGSTTRRRQIQPACLSGGSGGWKTGL